MTDERAALLITAYANGLRRELELLGASETTELISEIVSMLRDASEGDPEVVAAEIENLGPPEELARTILEQHGLKTGPGTPAPSWWRLGVAAPIDIVVGLAAPAAGIAFAFGVLGSSPIGDTAPAMRALWAAVSIAVIALTSGMAWAYWRPWREGGRSSTVGMTLAGISIVRVGRARTVALTRDLKAARLAHAQRSRFGAVLTLVIALAVLGWSVSALIAAAVGGAPGVERFVGGATQQERQVRATVDAFYAPQLDPSLMTDPLWSYAFVDVAATGDVSTESLNARATAHELRSYAIAWATERTPGVWSVIVDERGTADRTMALMLSLRVQWDPMSGARPSWVIVDYQPQ